MDAEAKCCWATQGFTYVIFFNTRKLIRWTALLKGLIPVLKAYLTIPEYVTQIIFKKVSFPIK